MIAGTVAWIGTRLGRESHLVRLLRPVYEAALVRRYAVSGMPWVMNGVTYRIDPRHRCRMGAEEVVIEYIRPRLRTGGVCFVLGANAGLYVLQLAHLSGPCGRVVAFEPNPTTVEVLRRHVGMNGLSDRVTIVSAVVGRNVGTAVLYAGTHSMLSRLGNRAPEMEEQPFDVEVPVTTLDAYCAATKLPPDWITMDIEGFEFAALEGAREMLRSAGRPIAITGEFHPYLWHLSGYDGERGGRLLADLGLEVWPLTGQTNPLREFGLVALESVHSGRN